MLVHVSLEVTSVHNALNPPPLLHIFWVWKGRGERIFFCDTKMLSKIYTRPVLPVQIYWKKRILKFFTLKLLKHIATSTILDNCPTQIFKSTKSKGVLRRREIDRVMHGYWIYTKFQRRSFCKAKEKAQKISGPFREMFKKKKTLTTIRKSSNWKRIPQRTDPFQKLSVQLPIPQRKQRSSCKIPKFKRDLLDQSIQKYGYLYKGLPRDELLGKLSFTDQMYEDYCRNQGDIRSNSKLANPKKLGITCQPLTVNQEIQRLSNIPWKWKVQDARLVKKMRSQEKSLAKNVNVNVIKHVIKNIVKI